MTPKEKAKELFDKFRKEFDWVERDYPIDLYRDTRQCALIAVDEILKVVNIWSALNMQKSSQVIYWEEVKQEIEKL